MLTKKKSSHLQRKLAARKPTAKVDPHVEEQFLTGRLYGELGVRRHLHSPNFPCAPFPSSLPPLPLLFFPHSPILPDTPSLIHFSLIPFPTACVSSRPGQSGRCDGYILEGKELEFYLKKLKSKKGK